MRISKTQYSFIQAAILFLVIAGLLYLYVSVASNLTHKSAHVKQKQHSAVLQSKS